MSWFQVGVRSPGFQTKIRNIRVGNSIFIAGAGKRPFSCQDTEVGRDIQGGLVMEKAFDLDLEIWLQFRLAETGVGREK